MTGPRAAKGTFPYLWHRTQAEIWESQLTRRERNLARIDELDDLSRTRALTDDESFELERLLGRIAA